MLNRVQPQVGPGKQMLRLIYKHKRFTKIYFTPMKEKNFASGEGRRTKRTLYIPGKVSTSLTGNSQATVAQQRSLNWAEMARPSLHAKPVPGWMV